MLVYGFHYRICDTQNREDLQTLGPCLWVLHSLDPGCNTLLLPLHHFWLTVSCLQFPDGTWAWPFWAKIEGPQGQDSKTLLPISWLPSYLRPRHSGKARWGLASFRQNPHKSSKASKPTYHPHLKSRSKFSKLPLETRPAQSLGPGYLRSMDRIKRVGINSPSVLSVG